MKISNELKTGAVVFGALVALFVILFQTGDISFGKKGYTVKTRFNFASGVKKYSPVHLAGIEVGEVMNIQILYEENETLIEAELWVEGDVRLRDDSMAMVTTMGLMGEQYIEIEPGRSTQFVDPGSTIAGRDPVNIEEILEKFAKVADEITLTLEDVSELSSEAKGLIKDNRPKVSNILDNIDLATEYFTEFAEDIKYHPWKVLAKGKEKTREEINRLRMERAELRAKAEGQQAVQEMSAVKEEEDETSRSASSSQRRSRR